MAENTNIFSCLKGTAWRRRRKELLTGTPADSKWHLDEAKMPLSLAQELLQQHQALIAAEKWISCTPKRRITKVHAQGKDYFVKEFVRLPLFGLLRPDRRSWLCGNRLEGAVEYLAWRKESASGYIIMASAGECNLDLRFREFDPQVMKERFRRAGELVALLHNQKIFHADLKPHNFAYTTENADPNALTIIDCDDVRFPNQISTRQRMKNLSQLLGGLGYSVRDGQLRRLFATAIWEGYCRHCPDAPQMMAKNHREFCKRTVEMYAKFHKEFQEIQDVFLA